MTIRITGMSSGLDIDKLVSDLMKAEKVPVDKLKQKKQTLTWTTDAYREVNTKLNTLRTSADKLRLSGNWIANKVSSSNESAVTVSASSTASTVTHSIEVTSLASGATLNSSAGISNSGLTGTAITAPVAVSSQSSNNELNITLNGTTKKIALTPGSYTSVSDLAAELQKQINTSFGVNQITVTESGGQITLTPNGSATSDLPQLTVSSVSGNTTGLSLLGFTDQQSYKVNSSSKLGDIAAKFSTALIFGTNSSGEEGGTFTVNGVNIDYSSSDTLSSVISKVNKSNAGVNMSYDSTSDKIMITSKTTGSAANIKVEDVSGNLMQALKLDSSNATSGKDAQIKIDGVSTTRSTNSFTMDGVTYTLKDKTDSPVSVSVTRDTDAIYQKIKDFVNTYNETIDYINTKLSETKDLNYPPLTDDQKKAMSDDEIKLWEDKAKLGLLHNDNVLKQVKSSSRSLFSTKVEGLSTQYDSLYKIGITTLAYNSTSSSIQDAGKLQIDDSALKEAIAADPDGVISLFANQPGTDDKSKTGLAQQMYDILGTNIANITSKAGKTGASYDLVTNTLGDQIYDLEEKISEMESQLTKKEDYYYKMFSAMETAIQNNNAQLSALTSYLG